MDEIAWVLTTATVCQLILSLIVERHLLPSEMKEQFSVKFNHSSYILPQINTLCVILEKLTKLIIHVYLELSAQSQYHSFLKKYNIA